LANSERVLDEQIERAVAKVLAERLQVPHLPPSRDPSTGEKIGTCSSLC